MSYIVRCSVVWCGAVQCGVVRCGAVRCGVVRFEPHGFGALDVGAGEALSEADNFIGAPLEPDRGGIGVVDESSGGLFLASDGIQNGVGDERAVWESMGV